MAKFGTDKEQNAEATKAHSLPPPKIDETRSIFYEDILLFKKALSDPSIPRATLKAKVCELCKIAARKKKET